MRRTILPLLTGKIDLNWFKNMNAILFADLNRTTNVWHTYVWYALTILSSEDIILRIWRFMPIFWWFLEIKNLHHNLYFSIWKATLCHNLNSAGGKLNIQIVRLKKEIFRYEFILRERRVLRRNTWLSGTSALSLAE